MDLTIFEYLDENKTEINILTSYGLKYGGKDIDKFISDKLLEENFDISNLSEEKKNDIKELLVIKTAKIKESLFEDDEEEVAGFFLPQDFNFKYTPPNEGVTIKKETLIEYFETIKIKEKIFKIIGTMLDEADIELEEVKIIKMLGGSSRIKYFREILTEYFNQDDIIDEFDSDENYYAITKGACKYLYSLTEKNSDYKLNNCAPYEIYIIENGQYKKIVGKNSKYEFYSISKPLKLDSDNRKLVYQGFPKIEEVEIDEEKIYLGEIVCDKSKYTGDIYYRIGTNKNGEITCRLYDSNNFETVVEEIYF